ncbi:hypothetical protein FKP32DRAFT_534 [Trametes sanguinea]|nr:hypothetical protein FKP32DRAFT_534 [Trametes sanguinea]
MEVRYPQAFPQNKVSISGCSVDVPLIYIQIPLEVNPMGCRATFDDTQATYAEDLPVLHPAIVDRGDIVHAQCHLIGTISSGGSDTIIRRALHLEALYVFDLQREVQLE